MECTVARKAMLATKNVPTTRFVIVASLHVLFRARGSECSRGKATVNAIDVTSP